MDVIRLLGIRDTPLSVDEVLAAARETASFGATEFCIVLAVRGPDERTMQRILEKYFSAEWARGMTRF